MSLIGGGSQFYDFKEQIFTRQFSWQKFIEIHHIFTKCQASEPETNERGSSLISRRLHYRGLQSLFLTKRKELWLCASGRFRTRSGILKELWLCANGKI